MELHVHRCLYYKQSYLLSRSHEHSPRVTMYCMLNPIDIIGQECSVWLRSFTLLPWKCTVLIRKGQLFILISSSLKWCFNVIYISHWLFELLNVFYYYLMVQNTELNIYIEYLISKPFWHLIQFFSCYRQKFICLFSNWQLVLLKVCCRNVQM